MSNSLPFSPAVPAEARSDYRRMTPTGRAPEIAALASKMVPEVGNQRFGASYNSTSGRRDRPLQAPDMGLLQRISDLTANDVSDAQTIFQLLPETELAMQILVSSILAPKDLVTTSVNFSLETNRFNSELAGSMLNVVTDHFEKIYKIKDLLKPCLEDALFLTGSYPLLILPESSIDRAINNPGRIAMEALTDDFTPDGAVRNMGFLGNPKQEESLNVSKINFALESQGDAGLYNPKPAVTCFGLETMVSFVDNFNVLKVNALQRRVTHDKTQQLLQRRGLTAIKGNNLKVSQEQYTASLEAYSIGQHMGYGSPRDTMATHQPVTMITPARDIRRATIGHPLVLKLPSESTIPVHQPSNPEKHLGYFILLDGLGNPLNSVSQRDFYADMANSLNPSSSMGSQLLQQAKRGMQGQATDRQHEIDEMARIYGSFLEKELMERLRAGIYGQQVEMTAPTEVYRVMLARACAKKQTQVLYVPAEMMTYVAFDYNKYGIGQSLLQKSKILGGIRVLNLFAETMGSIKNAINRTRLGITLDPEDPNPGHTVEFLMGEYAKTRQGSFPLGATNPTDVISYLQNASVDVEVTGNTRWPEVKFEVTERQSNRIKPEEGMTDSLRDRHLMSMGLSPDMVDAGHNAEFATSVLANNLLLAKRVLTYQGQLEEFLRDFTKKYILADGYLMDDLRTLIKENASKLTKEQQKSQELSEQAKNERKALTEGPKVAAAPAMESINEQLENLEDMHQDAVIMEFLQCVLVSLPKPDMATVASQMTAYENQEKAYDVALGAYINASYLESHGLGSMKDLVEPTKEAVKAELMRRWMRDNNVLPELHDLLTGEEDERPDIFRNLSEHVKSMGDSLLRIMYEFARQRQMNDPAVGRLAKIIGEDAGDMGGGGFDQGGGGDPFSAPSGGGMDDLPAMPEIGGGPEDQEVEDEEQQQQEQSSSERTTSTTDADGNTTTSSSSSSSNAYGNTGAL